MTNHIVVLGAGVSGLTAALLLSKSKANSITVIAKHMPGDYDIEYTSPWAGANVLPMAPASESRWERRTWPEMKRLAAEVPEAGIHFQKSIVYRRKKDIEAGGNPYDALYSPDPWYRDLMPDYRELRQEELPANAHSGCEFTSVCMNTALYLPYLVGQCRKNGVVFKRGVIGHIHELKNLHHTGKPADIIVNSSGLLACKLGGVEDKTVRPARGQVVVVRNEIDPMATISGTDDGPTEVCYMMTRAGGGGTILGGTYDKDNWDPNPDPNIAIRIMKRCVELSPALTGGKGIEALSIIRHGVGLRPYREGGLRLEVDKKTLDDGTPIVHHYGHAGWGYQGSYGTAEGVVELVNELRAEKGESLANEPKLFSWDRPSKL
ncbi:D-amino-acid oxidase [Colletotrichum trifolii]|uniref:D-amino-acid oxidase n=1 Tax=Colletotrichum trifolii TaxID=5466 RepID=A0A4R8QTU3_COLTR|nr:D-amino-acid oxidase [Colletotrichum trifolii]